MPAAPSQPEETGADPAGRAAVPKLVDLRRLLAERFPGAHARPAPGPASSAMAVPQGWPTGVPALDSLLGGGLPRGELTELVGVGPGSGSAQVLHAVLARATSDGRFLALVDGADSFDVDAAEPDQLARLLWVRCRNAGEALQATDLILRDRNLPLVVLDLKLNPVRELQRIASSVWHRLGRIAEHNGTTLLVVTPFPLVGAVSLRVEVRAALGPGALAASAAERLDRLRFETLRAAGERSATLSAAVG